MQPRARTRSSGKPRRSMAAVNACVRPQSIDGRLMPPQRRRKVCFVLPSLNGGGAERAAVQMLNGLDRHALGSIDVPVRAQGPYLC